MTLHVWFEDQCTPHFICTECRLRAYAEGRKQFAGPRNPYFGKEWKKIEQGIRNQARGVSVCGWCGRAF